MSDDKTLREADFFRDVMDPFVCAMVTAEDPWDAYNEVAGMRGSMLDYLEWGVHGGQVYVARADLADLYVTGTTPIEEAHAAWPRAAGPAGRDVPVTPPDGAAAGVGRGQGRSGGSGSSMRVVPVRSRR